MPLIDTNRVTGLVLLFSHPLPYIRRRVLQAHAVRFTACQELYGAAICLPDLPQVHHDRRSRFLQFDETCQFLDMLGLETTAENKDRGFWPHQSLNLQGHSLSSWALFCCWWRGLLSESGALAEK